MIHSVTAGSGSPVVLVHGFTQTSRSWGRIAESLSAHHRVIALDAPGHGASAEVVAGLGEGADMMVEAAGCPAAWVGYSMGGRYALHAALRHPAAVSRLVLVSATAGMDDPADRGRRRRRDEELARRVEGEGVERFVGWWLGQPMFATLAAEAAAAQDRLSNTSAGLASSLRHAGTGTQEPLWDALGSLDMPVLAVAGALDARYAALAERMATAVGANATLSVLPGAGHACHLERPGAFLEVVSRFLAGTGGG